MAETDTPDESDDLKLPTCDEFAAGIRSFETNEKRAGVYYDALSHVSDRWGDSASMASGVKMLLDSWHLAFYRFGNFDLSLLTECVQRHLGALSQFRLRSIATLAIDDHDDIVALFGQFLDALRGGKHRSPVAVAKTLHLLAPEFFPLWDTDIAIG